MECQGCHGGDRTHWVKYPFTVVGKAKMPGRRLEVCGKCYDLALTFAAAEVQYIAASGPLCSERRLYSV